MSKYTLIRSGILYVPHLRPENQCGMKDQKYFKFTTEIVANELDHRGFVCDNMDVQAELNIFFRDAGQVIASCEQLAAEGIIQVRRMCQPRELLGVKFSIFPFDDAQVSCEWERGQLMDPSWSPQFMGRSSGRVDPLYGSRY